ncbi:MAG: IclR family transcriptional regulator [Rhodoferax sp.]|nr:IclR family transcriptional regulator [Rhodoferax sp.]
MLDVLTLIQPGRSTIDIEHICQRLGYAPATAYRYVRELNQVGLLVRMPGGYALGPRVIELDQQIRENDPMLHHSRDLMAQLCTHTGLSVLLSALYDNAMITTHEAYGSDGQQLKFGRGRRIPLFRSSTTRVVLAYLPPRRLRQLYEQHTSEPEILQLLGDWKTFSRAMLQVRRLGYCLSRGELEPGRCGLSAPIFDYQRRVLGSISLVGSEQAFAAFDPGHMNHLVVSAAAEITRRITQDIQPAAAPRN